MLAEGPAEAYFIWLPTELISEIAIVGQLSWIEDQCDPHAATVGMRPLEINQNDCRGVTAGIVEHCLCDEPLPLQQPAHALMNTCSRIYHILRGNKLVWQHTANTLHKSLAELAGGKSVVPAALSAAGARFSYNTDILISENVCSCLIRGIRYFYPTLRVVKISLPWADFTQEGNASVAYFFCGHHSPTDSPLEYFDLRLHPDVHYTPRFLLAYHSPVLKTCRVDNAEFFLYGPLLRVLNITFPFGHQHCFGPNLLNALNLCPKLEFLTIDAGHGQLIDAALGDSFNDDMPAAVHLPSLRYLRLSLPANVGSDLLGLMVLPAGIDLHLEPVMSWSVAVSSYQGLAPLNFFALSDVQSGADILWRYTASLLAPRQVQAIFRTPSQFAIPRDGQEGDIVRAISTVAMDVRLDILSQQSTKASDWLPEVITFMLAASIPDVIQMLGDATRGSRFTPFPQHRIHTRRSISVRGSAVSVEDRRRSLHDRSQGFGYAVVGHVARILMDGQADTPYDGLGQVETFVIADESWIPDTPYGWDCILRTFRGIMLLNIRAPDYFNAKALVDYLQGSDEECPVPLLRAISLARHSKGTDIDMCHRLEEATNSPARLQAGAAVVRWVMGD